MEGFRLDKERAEDRSSGNQFILSTLTLVCMCVCFSPPPRSNVISSRYEAFKDRPFSAFLTHCKLSAKVQAIVIHAVALITSTQVAGQAPKTKKGLVEDGDNDAGATGGGVVVDTESGMRAVQRYLGCLGRFGSSAFLCALWGTSELPQAFCRLCAVHGGIYMLRTPVQSLIIEDVRGATPEELAEGLTEGLTGDSVVEESSGSTGAQEEGGAGDEGGAEGAGETAGGGEEGMVEAEAPKKEPRPAWDMQYRCRGVVDATGKVLGARWIVTAPEYLPANQLLSSPPSPASSSSVAVSAEEGETKGDFESKSDRAAAGEAEGAADVGGRLLRRVCVTNRNIHLSGKEEEGRTFIVVVPNTPGIDNESAIHVLQMDDDSQCAPRGYCLVYVGM